MSRIIPRSVTDKTGTSGSITVSRMERIISFDMVFVVTIDCLDMCAAGIAFLKVSGRDVRYVFHSFPDFWNLILDQLSIPLLQKFPWSFAPRVLSMLWGLHRNLPPHFLFHIRLLQKTPKYDLKILSLLFLSLICFLQFRH